MNGPRLLNRLADLPDMDEVSTAATAEYIDMRIESREIAVLGGQFDICNRLVGA